MKKIQLVIILLLTISANKSNAFGNYHEQNGYYSESWQYQQNYYPSQQYVDPRYNNRAPLPWNNYQNNQNCDDNRGRFYGYSRPTVNHYHNYYPPNYRHGKHWKKKHYRNGWRNHNRMIYPSNYYQNIPLGNVNIQLGF
jgi:hypothetical protein